MKLFVSNFKSIYENIVFFGKDSFEFKITYIMCSLFTSFNAEFYNKFRAHGYI